MGRKHSDLLALSLIVAAACGGSAPPKAAAPAAAPPAPHAAGLRIQLASIYVDDQDKALRFYTDVLGFAKKDDVTNGPYRWLTVTAPGDTAGTALQLAPNTDPAAKAYQQAMFAEGQPAAMFFTDDVRADAARIEAHGAKLAMPPTDIGFATIAKLDDTCGNLVQLTQLAR
jgi:predicted enzyme related to lactoylglutathione lyase